MKVRIKENEVPKKHDMAPLPNLEAIVANSSINQGAIDWVTHLTKS